MWVVIALAKMALWILFVPVTNINQLSFFLAFVLKNHRQTISTLITITSTKLYSTPKWSNKYYLEISWLLMGCNKKYCFLGVS